MTVARMLRWAALHGSTRVVLRARAWRGNLGAQLVTEPGLLRDPFPGYDRLREQGPLVPGAVSLTTARHDVCTTVLRSDGFGVASPERLVARPIGEVLARIDPGRPVSPIEAPSMLAVDPPDHTRFRKLVSRVFTARAVEALRPRVVQIADELLDAMAAEPVVDLVDQYATLLPVTVIAEILGVPVDMRRQFLRWGGGAAMTLDIGLTYRQFRQSEADLDALQGWLLGHFARLRRRPGDDLLSRLVAVADESGELSGRELCSMAMLLLGAGFETTMNLLGNGTMLLLRHPGELELLCAEPAHWPNAVEEILRHDSPVQTTARVSRRDTEVFGVAVPADALVVLLIGGANRDPAMFADPHRFDVRRPNAREHLAFSSGIHYCLGAALARLEGEVGLRALFDRFPDLELAGTPRWRSTRTLRGYRSIPVSLGHRRGRPAVPPAGRRGVTCP